MDFRLTDQQRELQDAARTFARKELPDLAREMEEKDISVPAEMVRRYGEMGFLGVNLPEEYGGLGLGHLEALLVLEQFAMISNFLVSKLMTKRIKTRLKKKIYPNQTALFVF